MGYNCAIYVGGLTREEHRSFLSELEEEGVLDEVRSISFTDDETISIIEYEGKEFLGRYGEFPLDEQTEPRLWVLFEFGDSEASDRICTFEEFKRLSDKLPKLEALRAEIESVTGLDTGGGIYGREGAYDPWDFDSASVADLPDPEHRRTDDS